MKNLKKRRLLTLLLIGSAMSLTYCTKTDQVLDLNTPVVTEETPTNQLVSIKVSTAPTIDGTVDASWANATILTSKTVVPSPGNGMFIGYIGKSYDVSLRSMYDNDYIYFLAEWNDPDASLANAPWYFNPTTHKWAQESTNPTFDVNGILTREPFNEDKFAFLWNISSVTFPTQSCYASCHMNTPTIDPLTGLTIPATSGNHFTNAANEKIDQWHIHLMKDVVSVGQGSDEYQDWNSGKINANGRHADGLIPPLYTNPTPTPGPTNNRQTIAITGDTTKVTIPRWVRFNVTNYNYVLAADTLAGSNNALLITAIDANGILTLSDGSTIDPTTDTDYQRVGAGVGAKCFPGSIVSPMQGSRGDLTCSAVHNGTKWIMEWKRLLNTGDALLQDVDFSSLIDQPFGIGVFNKANNQHAIKTDLMLTFKK